jgi:hypothetical protein
MRTTTLTVTFILSAGPNSVLATGGFLQSCDAYAPQGYGLDYNQIMSTSCQSSSSKVTRKFTTLDLNF